MSLTRVATAAAAVTVVLLCVVFFRRGLHRLKSGLMGAILWWFGALMGVQLLALGAWVLKTDQGGDATYSIVQQILRGGLLVTGVIFLMYVLAASLPLMLDALEARAFVSFVGARHIRATRNGFLTVISVLSIAGVGASSCALCSVSSVMGGFGHDLKRKILTNTAHVMVDIKTTGGFENWQPALAGVRGAVEPLGGKATPVVGGEAMASSVTNTAGTLMRGIDPDTIGDVIALKKNIEVGRFDYLLAPKKLARLPETEVIGRGPGGEKYLKGPAFRYPGDEGDPDAAVYPGIILGRELAKSLHVMVGDELTMLSPMGELGPTGIMPRSRKFRVAAIFYSGMYEYDASHAYVLMDQAQSFLDLKGRITNIDVRIPEPEAIGDVRPAVAQAVAAHTAKFKPKSKFHKLRVRDWKGMNKNLFSALKLEKIATFIILSIAIAVASFCIVCTLLLMVTEKTKEIAVLKALGAADRSIMGLFMLEGVIIGAIGTTFGVAVALASCLGLSWTGVRLDPDVYYIDRLPVNVDLGEYGLVAIAAMTICTLATVYPAYTASKVNPVEGLRYE